MRQKHTVLGDKQPGPAPKNLLLAESDPFSPQFVTKGVKNTTKDLTRYLLAQQQKAFGKTILETQKFSFFTVQRHMKALLEEYEADTIKRAIALSVRQANHPATIKFIRECAKWVISES